MGLPVEEGGVGAGERVRVRVRGGDGGRERGHGCDRWSRRLETLREPSDELRTKRRRRARLGVFEVGRDRGHVGERIAFKLTRR